MYGYMVTSRVDYGRMSDSGHDKPAGLGTCARLCLAGEFHLLFLTLT